MVAVSKKQVRIEEVRALLNAFSGKHLSSELSDYVMKLWEQIGRKRTYVITGGKKEIWASAVVYVIARLNFLFDRSKSNYLPPEIICDFFGTKKSTVSDKATQIEKACRIRMGHEGLCSPKISDNLTYVQLSNGMIISKRIAKEMGIMFLRT